MRLPCAWRTIFYPAVAPGRNGSNSANAETTYFDTVDRPIWIKDGGGYLTYIAYDSGTGAVSKQIIDVDTSLTGDFASKPSGWSTISGGGLHLKSTMDVDGLGRVRKLTDPGGKITYTAYKDATHEVRMYHSAAGTFSQVGPVYIMREYWPAESASSGERQVYTEVITSSATPSLTSSVPNGNETLSASNIQSLARSLTNDAGQVIEADSHFSLSGISYVQATPHLGSSSNDTSTGNYHRTFIDYNAKGLVKRIEDSSGTITRKIYDGLGRLISSWIGTNDTPTSGYWSPSNNSGANMGRVNDYFYDDGLIGDGNLTDIIQHVERLTGATGNGALDRHTRMAYDWRDRLVATQRGAGSETLAVGGTVEVGDKFNIVVTDGAGSHTFTYTATSTDLYTLASSIVAAINGTSDTYFTNISASVNDEGGINDRTIIFRFDDARVDFTVSVATTESDNSTADGQTFSRITVNQPISYLQYDNLGNVIAQEQYDGDGINLVSTGGVPDRPDAGLLRGQTTIDYDDRGRVYATHVFSVDPIDGDVSSASLDTNLWYDARGNVIKTDNPGGLIAKSVYDGAGRLTKSYATDGGGDSAPGASGNWDAADDVGGDIVLTQTETQYDSNGNVLLTTTRDRFHDDTTRTGDLGDPSSSGSTAKARVSYNSSYYDPANRLVESVNLGTYGGLSYTRPSTAPTRDLTVYTGTATATGNTTTLVDTGRTEASDFFIGYTIKFNSGALLGKSAQVTGYNSGTHTFTFLPAMGSAPGAANYSLVPNVLITTYSYDAAGQLKRVISPRGIENRSYYDMLGRTTRSIEAYDDNAVDPDDPDPTASTNRTTGYRYDGASHVVRMTAVLPDGSDSGFARDIQETKYVYNYPGYPTLSLGSGPFRNDVLWHIEYPDKSTGEASGDEAEFWGYNVQGEKANQHSDRDGTDEFYTYDVLGRLIGDTAWVTTENGANLDDTVHKRGYSYDSAGRLYQATSYGGTQSETILNQVRREYNGLGQLIAEYQDHAGAVDGSTFAVRYEYSEMNSGNHSRLTRIIYPGWDREVSYEYNSGIDDDISRLSDISDSASRTPGFVEVYSYLGLGTIVKMFRIDTNVALTYVRAASETSVGEGGDQYTGLDRFGRIVDQRWRDDYLNAELDRYQYGYDQSGNRVWRKNADTLATGKDELYSYDLLNRLTTFKRGTLADGNADGLYDSISSVVVNKSWTLDALGNWTSVTTNGTTVSRAHNSQNELTQVGSDDLSYDPNGNMVEDNLGQSYIYDAWNRLTKAGGQSYRYDALGRRIAIIQDTPGADPAKDLYYDAQWQVIQEDEDGEVATQYLWSPIYVDAMIFRDSVTFGRQYAMFDANFNVTSLGDTFDGTVLERYEYDPYGKVTVLNADWTVNAGGTDFGWEYLHQGGRYDSASNLYHFRGRDYNPDLGRWTSQDPMRYVDGANLYQYEVSDPTGMLDPMGTWGFNGAVGSVLGSGGGGPGAVAIEKPSDASRVSHFANATTKPATNKAKDQSGLNNGTGTCPTKKCGDGKHGPGWAQGKGYRLKMQHNGGRLPDYSPVPPGWTITWFPDGAYAMPPLGTPLAGYKPGPVSTPRRIRIAQGILIVGGVILITGGLAGGAFGIFGGGVGIGAGAAEGEGAAGAAGVEPWQPPSWYGPQNIPEPNPFDPNFPPDWKMLPRTTTPEPPAGWPDYYGPYCPN